MARITYRSIKLQRSTLALVETCNSIIADYEDQGFALTLRQLYYQLVSRDVIPNSVREYKRLGSIINDARLTGMVDWDAIEDRTRNLVASPHWESPREFVDACASQFKLDKWADQDYRVEVWIEKDALTGVIAPKCRSLDVAYFSCRGYTSQSEMHEAALRHLEYEAAGQQVVLLHFGDHDPSGIDMSRDIKDRLRLFGASTEVCRVALNMPQVEQYGPPPNPAKTTDSRFASYRATHGDESWELDALEPRVVARLIESHVSAWRDLDRWSAAVSKEQAARQKLRETADLLHKEAGI